MTTIEQSNLLQKMALERKHGLFMRGGIFMVMILAIFVLVQQRIDVLSPNVTPYSFNGLVYEPSELAPDFALTDFNNQPVQLSDFHGTPILLFFGFEMRG